MKQLLTWCGTRALGEKPLLIGEDGNAVLAGAWNEDTLLEVLLMSSTAREIQSQLLKDFSTKSSLSDWFSRVRRATEQDFTCTYTHYSQQNEGPPPPSPPKANPKNAANLSKIQELEQQLAR